MRSIMSIPIVSGWFNEPYICVYNLVITRFLTELFVSSQTRLQVDTTDCGIPTNYAGANPIGN